MGARTDPERVLVGLRAGPGGSGAARRDLRRDGRRRRVGRRSRRRRRSPGAGSHEQGLDVDQAARPDGVHWSPEASLRIADEFLGEQLIRAALAPVDATPVVARDHRLHRRRLLGEPRSRRLGVGGRARRRAARFGWRAARPRTSGWSCSPRSRRCGRSTPSGEPIRVVSDSTYVVKCFQRQVVGALGTERLAQRQEAAGRQRRPVEAARRVRARRQRRVAAG